MAAQFHKLSIKKYPKIAKRQTSDTRYWKKFSFPIVVKEHGAVTHVDFCPSKPHDFAVTSSSRVQIYSKTTNQVKKTISRFKEAAYSGTFRNDGQLLIAGGENGLIQLFDLNSRAVLRQFHGHTDAVHVTKFTSDNTHVLSASDDKKIKYWDLATEQESVSFHEHEDYIRTGETSQTSKDIFVTGSYDHTVKIWDLRSESSVLTVDHGSPVECVRLFPVGGLCVSAGSNIVKVWDILGGGRLLAGFSNHQKTITSLCFDGECRRLLSASIDRHVKVYDVQDYKVVHSLDYPSPVLSIGLSQDDTHLVAGMSDGLVSIKYRTIHTKAEHVPEAKPRGGSYRYFVRGKNYSPTGDEFVVSETQKQHLRSYDRYLRKFEYATALDIVLKPLASHPPVVVTVIQELIRRDGLKRALSGRNEEGLVPILYFLIRNITNPRYAVVLIDVANILLDMYVPILGQSQRVDELFMKLKNKLELELGFQQKAFELLGSLDTLFAAASASSAAVPLDSSSHGAR